MLDFKKWQGNRYTDDIDKVIGQNLKRLRLATGKSMEDVAGAIGVTYQQFSKYEQAQNRISIARAIQICRFLEVELSSLLAGTGAFDHAPQPLAADMVKVLSPNAVELAMTHDAIVSPSQRTALRNLARTLAQAED